MGSCVPVTANTMSHGFNLFAFMILNFVVSDTQILSKPSDSGLLPAQPSSSLLPQDQVQSAAAFPSSSFENVDDSFYYDDIDNGGITNFNENVERRDLFAGVDGGLGGVSFLAAMGSTLLAPVLSSGVSRILSGLPRLEITLPDEVGDIEVEVNTENVSDEEDEYIDDELEAMEAVTKVKRSPKFRKYF